MRGNYIKRIIISIANAASIASLAFTSTIPIPFRIIIGFIGIACLAYLLYIEFKENTLNERICTSEEEIKTAMKEIIKTQGKICVVSRDLTWVDNEVAACISAKKSSIIIFAEKENPTTQKLKAEGIKIKFYGHLGFEPKTRFTIIRYNSINPQVAIADTQHSIRKKKKFKHTIYETVSNGSKQDKWINSLALDMMNLFNVVCEDDYNAKENIA